MESTLAWPRRKPFFWKLSKSMPRSFDLRERHDTPERTADVQRFRRSRKALAQLVDHGAERRAAFHLIQSRPLEAAVQANEFAAIALLGTQLCEGRAAVFQHPRHTGERFHIVHHGRPVEEALLCGVGWTRAHFATLPFNAVEQRGLFAAHVCSCGLDHLEPVVDAAALDVGAEPPVRLDIGHGLLHDLHRLGIFRADVQHTRVGPHAEAGDHHAQQYQVRSLLQQVAIAECRGITFIGVAHDVLARCAIARGVLRIAGRPAV